MIRRPVVWLLAALLVAALTFTPGTAEAHSARPRSRSPGSINGQACGGDLPPCFVLRRESGGNPLAQNRRSSASGLWQMVRRTADTAARAIGRPDLVGRPARTWTVEEQNVAARWLWDTGRGCRHWRAC